MFGIRELRFRDVGIFDLDNKPKEETMRNLKLCVLEVLERKRKRKIETKKVCRMFLY